MTIENTTVTAQLGCQSSPVSETLKPCPFCGGKMEEVTDEDGHYWVHPGRRGIERDDCWLTDAWISDEPTGEGSIGEWNTRADGHAQPAPSSPVSESLRERIAKAIHGRRYQLGAKDVNSMFAWYAEDPKGTDRSRMAIYSAYRDADAVIDILGHAQTPAVPEDYVLMPREATRAMTMAACDSLPSCEHIFGHAGEMLSNCYRKMVAVADTSTLSNGGDGA